MRSILVLALVLAVAAADFKAPQRIVGGSVTTINQYPTIAALLFSQNGVQFWQWCGGSILNNRSILSAAHCPFGHAVNRWRVRLGSTWGNSGGTVYNFASFIVHPNYNRFTLDNDVVIMRVSGNIVFNNVMQPARIAGANYALADNQVVWAAGWGHIQSGGPSSEQLRHVQVWTINQAVCRSRYVNMRAVTDNMLCSGWLDVGGRDQCQGDSGGPLYHNGIVVGVCSWGEGCALARFPGVNARVSRYTAWIQSNA